MPSIPKLLAKELGKQKQLGFGSLTLTRVTPGTRTPGDPAAGNNPTTTDYPCKGRLGMKKSTVVQGNTLVRTQSLVITILGATLPTGITPRVNDTIVRNGVTYTITTDGAVNPDGLGAVYDCSVRTSGG
jgi:hypothetical protein